MSNPRKPETVSVRVRETTYEIVKELSEKHGCKAVQVWDMMLEHYLATTRPPTRRGRVAKRDGDSFNGRPRCKRSPP